MMTREQLQHEINLVTDLLNQLMKDGDKETWLQVKIKLNTLNSIMIKYYSK